MLGDFLITVVWLFFWTMALMIFISVFSDVFRREDISPFLWPNEKVPTRAG